MSLQDKIDRITVHDFEELLPFIRTHDDVLRDKDKVRTIAILRNYAVLSRRTCEKQNATTYNLKRDLTSALNDAAMHKKAFDSYRKFAYAVTAALILVSSLDLILVLLNAQ